MPIIQLWPEGSRADFPAIADHNPNLRPEAVFHPKLSARGVITSYSDKSRRNFLRLLSTIIRDQSPFTMALTLPGCFEEFDSEFLVLSFKKLGERFSRQCQKRVEWRSVSVGWKKEVQKRGALHWHLLFYGLEDNPKLAEKVRAWFVRQWTGLICADLPESERRKHFAWHNHERNWEPVRNVAYFTKYVGKDFSLKDGNGSTGRWWGFWNRDAVPWSSKVSAALPDRVSVDAHRVARKILQKRMDRAKQSALFKRSGLPPSPFSFAHGNSEPISLWDLERLKGGFSPRGRNKEHADYWREFIRLHEKKAGIRFGKYRIRFSRSKDPSEQYSPRRNNQIVLTGDHVPDMVDRILNWSYERNGIPRLW